MIFQRPRKLTALQIVALPVALPLLGAGLALFAVPMLVAGAAKATLAAGVAVSRLVRKGFWGV
jgi:hypothetical protein